MNCSCIPIDGFQKYAGLFGKLSDVVGTELDVAMNIAATMASGIVDALTKMQQEEKLVPPIEGTKVKRRLWDGKTDTNHVPKTVAEPDPPPESPQTPVEKLTTIAEIDEHTASPLPSIGSKIRYV